MNDDWKKKLARWDTDLLHMVGNLTGKPVEPKNGGDNYFFEVEYAGHEPDEVSAWADAIRGRAGTRLAELYDRPDDGRLFIRVSFADFPEDAPRHEQVREPNPDAGDVWCPRLREVRAVRVLRENEEQLRDFVGGGSFLGQAGRAVFEFLNIDGSTQYVVEGNYLVWLDGRFEQIDAEGMEAYWEPK